MRTAAAQADPTCRASSLSSSIELACGEGGESRPRPTQQGLIPVRRHSRFLWHELNLQDTLVLTGTEVQELFLSGLENQASDYGACILQPRAWAYREAPCGLLEPLFSLLLMPVNSGYFSFPQTFIPVSPLREATVLCLGAISQCQSLEKPRDLLMNNDSNQYVMLKSGTNILYWRTTGILMGSKAVKPVLVKNITIEEEGSSECTERPPCTSKDYFQIHTPCDEEGKDINRKSTNVVESWGGTKEKQAYTHVIFKNATFTFTWAFQRTNQGQDNRRFINDMVKIYSITATNAVDGVASSCRACALGSEQSGSSCVPCPPGHYIEKETNQCMECPPDTYLSIHQVYGKEACIPCGPGSRSTQDHSVCYSDCFFYHEKENQSLHYDFSNLSSVGSLMNGPSFTSKGTKYFHFFNISLCGHEVSSGKGKKLALCTNNITDFTVKEMVAGSDDYTNLVGAFVCQSTIIPSESKGFRAALSSQSIILADTFLGVTVETTLQNINVKEDMFPVSPSQIPDVHFFYNKCPAGTCDGCTFYFLWESVEACPLCTEHDFHEIEGACKRGFQETLYVWNEPKWCIKGISLPEKKLSTCETVDFWLKVGAGVGAFTAVLLVALTCYFWKKNQKLEYKYSKLVMTTNSKEFPAADSCAIMEGEENEEEVVYSNKQSLLGKLKSLATKSMLMQTHISVNNIVTCTGPIGFYGVKPHMFTQLVSFKMMPFPDIRINWALMWLHLSVKVMLLPDSNNFSCPKGVPPGAWSLQHEPHRHDRDLHQYQTQADENLRTRADEFWPLSAILYPIEDAGNAVCLGQQR
ncbi:KIAA1324L [Cervus elaphus hippelaphus]|uniref:KIAA1324L n=1 Tax=Cervus elaphus hippelaphus TaxID=46360 RepID=A0A212CKN4_CEREH|nr:KIAA1324L [Cervus elaphus hippelaphus]